LAKGYEHRYKHGKQEDIIPFKEIKQKVIEAKLPCESEAYFWLLYYCGVRKSEGFERVKEDFKITKDFFIIDFGQRKKNGATVPPLKIPVSWYGVDKIIKQVEKARPRVKTLFTSEPTRKTKKLKSGAVVPIKKRVGQRVRARFVFPSIQSTKAWDIAKKVLGEKHYPHFLRLNCLSEICSDPTTSFTRLKSFSGIKSLKALNAYLGQSEKEQDKAIAFRGQHFE